MKKDNLKRIIKQLETLIEELKSEVYSDKDSYVHPWDEHMKNTPRIINSEDDDGYAEDQFPQGGVHEGGTVRS